MIISTWRFAVQVREKFILPLSLFAVAVFQLFDDKTIEYFRFYLFKTISGCLIPRTILKFAETDYVYKLNFLKSFHFFYPVPAFYTMTEGSGSNAIEVGA